MSSKIIREGAFAIRAASQVQRIATAPIGGVDHFPPKTPGGQPLDHVLLWQPAHGRWPALWRFGFWGGAEQPFWYDDQMSLMEPQPTHWTALPPKPVHFAADVDAAHCTIGVAGKACQLSPSEFRLFEILYQVDLADGEWRSLPWLGEQLGAGQSIQELRRQMEELQRKLAGSRFTVESNRGRWRLAVKPIAPPPARRARLAS